jgi:RNA polymerase sigma factor (sigma-70 family)
MLSMNEAEQLMQKFIELKTKFNDTKSAEDKVALDLHRKECVEKFNYLITMKTGKYKTFSNYEDLNQEGREALIKAMNTFNPKKGNWFGWAHHYIGTRISRSANFHTTIRFPLKVAKATPPHRESNMPVLVEDRQRPDREVEQSQIKYAVRNALTVLSDEQKEMITLAYGFDGDKPMSINKICKRFHISRLSCLKMIKGALSLMRENIKL